MRRAVHILHLLWPLLAMLAHTGQAVAAEEAAVQRIEGAGRVVAIADIHGAYGAFVELLRGTGLADESLAWTGGSARLVIVGDVLDRGEESRAALDLVMRLEEEAAAVSGGVHMVLGNHEVMNLVGELGYVSREEFSAYRDLESGGDRRRAEARFSAANPGLTGLSLRSAFGRQYPRGFFGHRAAFAPDGRYGAWLLRRPVLLVVNDVAFVHAGLSPRLIGQGLEEVNAEARAVLTGYLEALGLLIDEGLLAPETDFHLHARTARAYLARRGEPVSELDHAAARLIELAAHPLFAPDGPVWYRGMVDCGPVLEEDRLGQALAALGAERLVIGHTPTSTHRVQERFGGGLLLADTGMLASHYGGQPAALIFEGGEVSVFYPESGTREAPSPMPRAVGPRVFGLSDAQLETVLAEAPVTAQRGLSNGARMLSLEYEGDAFGAVFHPAPAPGFVPEAAAYRLDRLLGVDMVPVAVRREVDGEEGALALATDALPSWESIGGDVQAWCPRDDQLVIARSFDALLGVAQREPVGMKVSEGNGSLLLSRNHAILERGGENLAGGDVLLTPALRTRLLELDDTTLATALGDVLDPERLRRLALRRDALLQGRE